MIEFTDTSGSLCGSSVIGAAHRQLGTGNQDACLGDMFGDWSLIAVADGHGSAPHFRSDRGARWAVEAAREAIGSWTLQLETQGANDTEWLQSLSELPSLICRHWRAFVDEDLRCDPVAASDPKLRFLPYGTTLAVAALSRAKAVCVQIGDGDILLDDGNGTLLRPLPDDTELVGEQTYSLCLPDPMPYFRCALLDLRSDAAARPFATASTDGLRKSYASDAHFRQAIQHWQGIVVSHGIGPVVAGLDDWLTRVTDHGNGDDISLMICASGSTIG